MKSARNRACEAAEAVGLKPSQRYYLTMLDELEKMFTEHAEEQRRLCARAVDSVSLVSNGRGWDAVATLEAAVSAAGSATDHGEKEP